MTSDASTGNHWSGPISQADLVQYQAGSVVSRTLIKKPTGTVTVFAFDAGEVLSEHTSPFDALLLTIDGEAEIAISGVPHILKAADIIMLPAHEPHGVKALTRFKMMLVMIRA